MGSSVNIATPAIGRDFGMSAVLLGWVSSAYLLAAAMFLVPFGKLADIHGRKRIFVCGIVIDAVASLLAAVAPSSATLIVFRFLQGMGGAMIFGTGVAILSSVYPAGERGKALGLTVAAVYTGLSVGPFCGGLITEHLGWRWIFVSYLPLELVILRFARKLEGEWAEAKGERFDVRGALLYSLSLTAIMFGFSELPKAPAVWLILLGAIGLAGFVRLEWRLENPILDMRLFKGNRPFTLSCFAALVNYSATFAVGFLLSLYLQYVKHLTAEKAGLVLVAQPIMMAVLSPFAGRLSDRTEPRLVASIGMAITSAGLFSLLFLNRWSSLVFILACLVLLGVGFALFSSPNANAIMSSVERRFYGVASGILGTTRVTGQMFSMGIVMLLFAVILGRTRITSESFPVASFLRSAHIAFGIFTLLCVFGVVASLARGKVRDGEPSGGSRG
ncbi:MAG: MFS transporter [Armatimonadetes bacterium]|nr:MFS transporter [Armatimonadota bacterium]